VLYVASRLKDQESGRRVCGIDVMRQGEELALEDGTSGRLATTGGNFAA
jgi:hypothetical protein